MPMAKRTPLYDTHVAAGARVVDFGGWEMPLHYGSQIEEHNAVRRDAGIFDVSHMRVVDLDGVDVRECLRWLLANDVARLERGRALYSCLLREDGGVLDDLIAYWTDLPSFRLVVNASTADKDVAWIRKSIAERGFACALTERGDLALIAVQGPQARARLARQLPQAAVALQAMKPFSAIHADGLFIGRTGYTGEDGCEIAVPPARAVELWRALVADGVVPCGLGARDTLRLEAGMNLYGNDMDENVSPLESGLGWTVDLKSPRPFVGRDALEAQLARGNLRRQVGLLLRDRSAGVLRAHQHVATAHGPGEITSGTFGPTIGASIALARVPGAVADGDTVTVDLRGRAVAVVVVKPPFVRNGRVLLAS
jgi:aminomethyltransferase